MTADPADSGDLTDDLRQLAAEFGVSTEYTDWQGRPVQVPRHTVAAVLAALGVTAETPEQAARARRERELAHWRRPLPPCVVTRQGQAPWVPVHVTHGRPVQVWVELEGTGERRETIQRDRWVEPFDDGERLIGEATFEVPGDLPLGWHTLRSSSADGEGACPVAVTPAYLGLPPRLAATRTWGFMTQLYQVRSRRSWGVGDLDDLAELAAWSGRELGAGFVLVNPLHAAEPAGAMTPSPYRPTTRRFVNPLYLRVEAVPELAYLGAEQRAQIERLAGPQRARDHTDDLLDRDAVWAAKRQALELVFAVPRSPRRQAAFEAFRAREGEGLERFATWSALTEEHGPEWPAWPEALHDPDGPEVAAERDRLAARIDFHCWLQWLLDEQLGAAQRAAHGAGMPVGIVHDLAVGVHSSGSDSWALGSALARGIGVGAPADAFNQQGQNWHQPPWRPDRLAELGYAPYRDMLRTVLRHAGGIRIDHVLGLYRLWWVPEGNEAHDGTYVRYDHEALVGILALEAHRAGAFVVGEDLGTVEPWVRDYLRERGILGTSILWFEKDYPAQDPLPPERWRELCLATVTTHDLPPTAGYLAGEHIRIRAELGLLTRSVEQEREVDAADQRAFRAALVARGLMPTDADVPETVTALHRFLSLTPSRLLGVALADAAGDRRAINQPGTDEEYPNWRFPLVDGQGRPVLLEELVTASLPRRLAEAVRGPVP